MKKAATTKEIKVGLVQINNSFSGQDYFPLSVALLQAYAQQSSCHAQSLKFLLPVFRRGSYAEMLDRLEGADVAGFSIYVWNQNISLELARRLKESSPSVLTVFGGPQVPDQAEEFLRKHPFVDIVCHGEGEQVFAEILDAVAVGDWSGIQSVSYLENDIFHFNPRVSRIEDLSEVPSPYLEGCFDSLLDAFPDQQWLGLWETNRGCPFKCAFCEWGAESHNKLMNYDVNRALAEIEWMAKRQIEFVFCCDANFGLQDRDLTLAEGVVDIKRREQYPHVLSVQSAKNSTDRIYRIQKLLADSGMSKGVLLALQSVNPDTLELIGRQNIDLETFFELQRRFSPEGIETFTDIILGLPGETYESFSEGVSSVIDRGQYNRIQFINLSILGNSAMGQKAYQDKHDLDIVKSKIVNIHGARQESDTSEFQDLVVGTAAMPRDEWIRTRVFSWMTSLLFFDKLLQVPLAVIRRECDVDYRELIAAFTDTDNDEIRIFSELSSGFRERAIEIQSGGEEYRYSEEWLNMWWPDDEYMLIKLAREEQLNSFYAEAGSVLRGVVSRSGSDISETLIADSLVLNHAIMKLPFLDKDIDVECGHNIWEYYQGIVKGTPVSLESDSCSYIVHRGKEVWSSWDDWCREVIWYGNKRGAYIYDVSVK